MANTVLPDAPAGPSSASPAAATAPPVDLKTEAEAFKRLYPREYLSRFLDAGYRPDGRKSREWREAAVNIGARRVRGVAECRRG